jgi:hypothetical protein
MPHPRDLERLANLVRRQARVSDDDLLLAPEIAARVLGEDGITFSAAGGVPYLDGDRIVVPEDHPDLNFAVAHELAEWALREHAKYRGPHVLRERAANYLAAAILAPAPTVRRAHAHFGEKLRTIAKTFALSQTSTALRLAEVRRGERAVVTRSGYVLLRTHGSFGWQDVPILDVARGRRWKGLVRTRLRGGIDEGRVALRAE